MADTPNSVPESNPANVGPSISKSLPAAQFTEEQRDRLGEWFRTQWKHGNCPVCDHNIWATPDKAWEIRPFRGGQTVIGGPGGIIPMFPVTCVTCGYILWINAIVSGVIGGSKPTPTTTDGNP